MSRVSKRLSALVAGAMMTVGGVSVMSARPAASALPTCEGQSSWELPGFAPLGIPTRYAGIPSTADGSYDFGCVLGVGNATLGVQHIQLSLDACYGENLDPDAKFGRLTRAALRRAQHSAGVSADGVYGPNTAGAMRHLFLNGGDWTCATLAEGQQATVGTAVNEPAGTAGPA